MIYMCIIKFCFFLNLDKYNYEKSFNFLWVQIIKWSCEAPSDNHDLVLLDWT